MTKPGTEIIDALLMRLDQQSTSPERAQTVREILQQAISTKNCLQVRIAELLTEVQSRNYWRDWGYPSFKEFVETECPFKLRKAQQMITIFRRFVHEIGLPIERMQNIEWTKAALAATILTVANAPEWLEKIERLSYRDLKVEVEHLRRGNRTCNLNPAPPTASLPPAVPTLLKASLTSKNWRLERPPVEQFYIAEETWEQLCYAIAHAQESAVLKGPSGCGKSEVCKLLAKAAGRSCQSFNFGAMTEPRTTLIGTTHLDRRGTRFQPSRFVTSVQDPTAVILLDELSRAGKDAFNILLPLLDTQGYLALDESESCQVIRRAAGTVFLATANVGVEYSGTEAMDHALMDRFAIQIAIEWPPEKAEITILLHRCPGLSDRDAHRLVKIANHQRQLAREGEFLTSISTRSLIAAGNQIAAGIQFETAFKYCVLLRFSDEGGDSSERARLLQILQKVM